MNHLSTKARREAMLTSLFIATRQLWKAEYEFHPTRKWLFDFALPSEKIAIEINGGIWRKKGGAHQGANHYRDMEKLNAAQELGWRVFQFAPEQMNEMFALLRRIL